MESRILIDSIVRQTTLLIAQLATSAGIRAPLAHLADQVFLELSHEIEQQGVTRKVAADMFGLALRRYQRKVNRLRESVSFSERTLWQAVLELVTERGSVTRAELAESFKHDEETDVAAVLNDLVASGLLYSTGRGRSAAYRSTSQSDREHMAAERTLETLTHLAWLSLAVPGGLTREELTLRCPEQAAHLDAALSALLDDGRAERLAETADERFHSKRVMIPVGSKAGWESAVFDHYRAVCSALANKVRMGGASAAAQTLIGGTTLSFDLTPQHPHAEEVKNLLTRVRADALDVWKRVAAYNAKHPPPDDKLARVTFMRDKTTSTTTSTVKHNDAHSSNSRRARVALSSACAQKHEGPQSSDTATNWLRRCASDRDCTGAAGCLDAVCTVACELSAPDACGQSLASLVCDANTRACDLPCQSARACAALGAGYTCEAGRCRGRTDMTSAPSASPLTSASADTEPSLDGTGSALVVRENGRLPTPRESKFQLSQAEDDSGDPDVY